MRFCGGKLFTGGKDGFVKVIDPTTQSEVASIDFGGVMIRAVDSVNSSVVVGCRNGCIYLANWETGEKRAIMESHSDGEVWGLAVVDSDTVITSGDDNQIKAWSVSERKCKQTAIVSENGTIMHL